MPEACTVVVPKRRASSASPVDEPSSRARLRPRQAAQRFSWRTRSSVRGVESRYRWAHHRADRAKGDWHRMALGFYITAKGFTQERYDTTTVQLEEAGAGAMVRPRYFLWLLCWEA